MRGFFFFTESQIVCGRWRSMLFNGLHSTLDKGWDLDYVEVQVTQFENEVINYLFEAVFAARNNKHSRSPHIPQLHELFKKCLEWNQRAKSQMFSMDYVSVLLPNKGPFDSTRMHYLDGQAKSTTIVAATTLGLQSEIAKGMGWANGTKPTSIQPDSHILEKVTVITDDYFRSH